MSPAGRVRMAEHSIPAYSYAVSCLPQAHQSRQATQQRRPVLLLHAEEEEDSPRLPAAQAAALLGSSPEEESLHVRASLVGASRRAGGARARSCRGD